RGDRTGMTATRHGRDFIARHGETVFNAARRLQGDAPHTPLTRAGFAQAEEMGRALRDALGERAQFHSVPGAGHFSFLVPCGVLGPPALCDDGEGFDRPAFHARMNASVIEFFDQHLKATPASL
ncbi:hypothetical protein LTR94_030589, partial [Friedmanniomyces endolithicus]